MKQLTLSHMTRQLLRYYRSQLKKQLGQHLLAHEGILQEIARLNKITSQTTVVEIGAGIANLTRFLAQDARRVVAIELDPQFEPFHRQYLRELNNTEFIYGDVLKLHLRELIGDCEDLVITGNIPFQITSPLVLQLLESDVKWRRIVLTMQKEVGERITALPGNRRYGVLTLKAHMFATPRMEFLISRSHFIPAPKVDSAVVSFLPERPYPEIPMEAKEGLFDLINGAFQHRRKMLRSTLRMAPLLIPSKELERICEELGIATASRPEQLTLEQFYQLYRRLKQEKLVREVN